MLNIAHMVPQSERPLRSKAGIDDKLLSARSSQRRQEEAVSKRPISPVALLERRCRENEDVW